MDAIKRKKVLVRHEYVVWEIIGNKFAQHTHSNRNTNHTHSRLILFCMSFTRLSFFRADGSCGGCESSEASEHVVCAPCTRYRSMCAMHTLRARSLRSTRLVQLCFWYAAIHWIAAKPEPNSDLSSPVWLAPSALANAV